jgi:hypothetical protein
MALTHTVVFWPMLTCSMVGEYQRFCRTLKREPVYLSSPGSDLQLGGPQGNKNVEAFTSNDKFRLWILFLCVRVRISYIQYKFKLHFREFREENDSIKFVDFSLFWRPRAAATVTPPESGNTVTRIQGLMLQKTTIWNHTAESRWHSHYVYLEDNATV